MKRCDESEKMRRDASKIRGLFFDFVPKFASGGSFASGVGTGASVPKHHPRTQPEKGGVHWDRENGWVEADGTPTALLGWAAPDVVKPGTVAIVPAAAAPVPAAAPAAGASAVSTTAGVSTPVPSAVAVSTATAPSAAAVSTTASPTAAAPAAAPAAVAASGAQFAKAAEGVKEVAAGKQ